MINAELNEAVSFFSALSGRVGSHHLIAGYLEEQNVTSRSGWRSQSSTVQQI